MNYKILTILFGFLVLISCTSDNYEDYYGEKCDDSNVSYSASIQPLLQNRCISCHNSNFPSGGVRLDNFSEVKKQVDSGRLLGSIKHEPEYAPMPQGSKLDDCSINKVEIWINNGAQNN